MVTNLVLDEELDTLDGGGSGLGDSGRDTTHYNSISDPFAEMNWCNPSLKGLEAGNVSRTQEVNDESL